MKLTHLVEMAAKRLCDQCGKSMAANHYWYKGGWRCKKEKPPVETPAVAPPKVEVPAPVAKAAPSPAKDDHVSPWAPPAPKEDSPMVRDIKRMLPKVEEYGTDRNGFGWGVFERDGNIEVYWEYTYRRNTAVSWYHENKYEVKQANGYLEAVASKYKDNFKNIYLFNESEARETDEYRRQDNGSAYSEYEQSVGSNLNLNS